MSHTLGQVEEKSKTFAGSECWGDLNAYLAEMSERLVVVGFYCRRVEGVPHTDLIYKPVLLNR